jgi:hypothetical protein
VHENKEREIMKKNTNVSYADTTGFDEKVTFWQGLRNDPANAGDYVIAGTSGKQGLVYFGPLNGGGTSYFVNYPGAKSTSVYGPDSLADGRLRLVGSIVMPGDPPGTGQGFLWEGTLAELPSGGAFRAIAYPGATVQYTHSAMGALAVGNADGPTEVKGHKAPLGAGVAYIYDIESAAFVATIVYPGSRSNTVYGIWYNGGTSYTLCGAYSPAETNNLADPSRPLALARACLVDYDSATNTFSNWTSFDYPHGPDGVDLVTHFQGISSVEPGVYTLGADAVIAGSDHAIQGSWVRVIRKPDGTFDQGTWINLDYPTTTPSATSANSVYGNAVVGILFAKGVPAYQALVDQSG